MAIREHPPLGTLLLCDFSQGFSEPEMVKRRPVVVISPKITARVGLCTVVPISSQPPRRILSYHYEIKDINPNLPAPFDVGPNWVKGDMVVSVGFHRLDFFRYGKDSSGKRIYRYETLSESDIKIIRSCVLNSLGLAALTKHLP